MNLVRPAFHNALAPHMPSLSPKLGFQSLGMRQMHLAPRSINPRQAAAIRAKYGRQGQTETPTTLQSALVKGLSGGGVL